MRGLPGSKLQAVCALQALQKRRQKSKLRTWEHLVLGGFSGACAATVTTPLDVAKTKLQCGVRAPLHEILRQTLEKRGPAGLFAGMVRPLTSNQG